MITNIYVLQDETGRIRYIGKTIFCLAERLRKHLWEARSGKKDHRCDWIRSVISRGFLPTFTSIGEVDGNGSKEEIAWIAYGRAEGWDLVNGTIGGDGGMLGRKASPETRLKMSISHKGKRKISKEHRQKLIIGRSKVKICVSEETRKKLSEANKGRPSPMFEKHHSEVTKFKMSMAGIGRKLSEETKEKMRQSCKTRLPPSEKTRVKMSESAKQRCLTEEGTKNLSNAGKISGIKKKNLKVKNECPINLSKRVA